MLAERSNPTEQEVYAGRLAEETNISKTAIMTQLETAVKRAGSKHRWEKKQQALKSGEMNQINVPYSAGGSQALGIASAQQRLLAAILREPHYIDLVQGQLTADVRKNYKSHATTPFSLNCFLPLQHCFLPSIKATVSDKFGFRSTGTI